MKRMGRTYHIWRTIMETDYNKLIENIDAMVKVLEVDGSRSPGKMKMNSQHLHSLYYLREVYENKLKTVKKPAPKAASAQ